MKHLLLITIAAVLLVGCGKSNNTESDDALRNAVKAGNIETVKQHLDAGADVNAKDDVVEWTPLLHAAEGGHKEIIELLIAKGADVNAKNLRGETSLYDVVGRGHKEIAELLIAAGADVNAKNTLGWTPLARAIRRNRTETADLLRKHGGKTGEELKAERK